MCTGDAGSKKEGGRLNGQGIIPFRKGFKENKGEVN